MRALGHALDSGRLHHAYLFTGTRGVGKTTIARILAKAVNCERGVSSSPCGICRACVEIDGGRFVDYLELDAASNRGVDEMVQLLENAVYSPTVGRYKVYVIDEVHMLTTHAFNAMLKTLEEPPGHVLFVLATTDPQKVPVTVLSRCMQFNLRNMAPDAIARHLGRVLEAEAVQHEKGALALLGRAAAGSMRDALSLLDQAIAFGGGRVDEPAVREMLGTVDRSCLPRLLDALIAGDGAGLLALADEVCDANVPPERVLSELAVALQRIATAGIRETRADAGDGGADDRDDAAALGTRYAGAISPEDLQVYYQIAIYGARDMPIAPDPHTGFSMTLLRLLAFRADPRSDEVAQAPSATGAPAPTQRPGGRAVGHVPVGQRSADQDPRAGPAGVTPRPERSRPGGPAAAALALARRAAGESESEEPAAEPEPRRPGAGTAPSPAGTAPAVVGDVAPGTAGDAPGVRISSPGTAPDIGFDGDWAALAARVAVNGLAAQFLRQSELLAHEGASFRVRVPIRALAESTTLAKVRDALSAHFGRPVRVTAEVGTVVGATASSVARAAQQARTSEARASLESDPFVRSMLDDFGASIVPDSVAPVDRPARDS